MKKRAEKQTGKKPQPPERSGSVCTNKDCLLRKEKGCKGFEACPGYKGR